VAVRALLLLALLAGATFAQDDLARRVEQLEQELARERARGDAQEQRLRELETALQKATDALAQATDRRGLEEELDAYLEAHAPREPLPPPLSRLNIGGVLVLSYRWADTDARSENTFLVDERYLRFVYRFSDQVTARYYTNGSLAELEWAPKEFLRLNVGRVVVPFGQFNARSFPDTFDTLSRPLLYDDMATVPPNNPAPVFRSLYSDTGVVVSGDWWHDENQLYYAAFVTNGLVGANDLEGGASFSDNNDNKQIGVRVAYMISSWFRNARLGVGGSAMGGKYDSSDRLSYRMYGGDLVYVLDSIFRNGEGSLTVRAEYVYAPREILYPATGDPTQAVNAVNRTQGAYVLVEARLDRHWMVYAEGDWMQQRAPLVVNNTIDPANLGAVTSVNWRFSLGVVYRFGLGIVWKNEYAYWEYDLGAPSVNTFFTQLVIPF